MRPVLRGDSPLAVDFDPYSHAQHFLMSRLGNYCSYCERRIATNLAVEHIQPKSDPSFSHLIGAWHNFLLACVNCNSTKKDKLVTLSDILLPDRDNTFIAFTYRPDGIVEASPAAIHAGLAPSASATLTLTGLDKKICTALDENDKQVSIDRVAQRMEIWAVAVEAKSDVDANPGVIAVRIGAARTAKYSGFFSIWMAVFSGDVDMANRLIDAFSGTRKSGCFDPLTGIPISPSPNADGLSDGGKM